MTEDIRLGAITLSREAQPRIEMDLWTGDEYARDMAAGAVFPPIVVFWDGETYWLADGFHRVYAAQQIGRETISADVGSGGLREAVLYSVGANASHGRRRTNADKRAAALKLLNDPEWSRWSDREIARRCHVTHHLIADLRSSLGSNPSERVVRTKHGTVTTMQTANIGSSRQVNDEVRERLLDSPFLDRQDNVERLARLDEDKQVAISEIVVERGVTRMADAWRLMNKVENERRVGELPERGDRWHIHHCRASDLKDRLSPKSVDVIITDPPYPEEFLDTFDELADLAAYVLRDGGLCVAMVGKQHLPAYMDRLGSALRYHWLSPFMETQTARVWDRRVYTAWKPLLIYSNGPYDGPMFNDVIHGSEPPDKALHVWEQAEDGMRLIVERFSQPAEVVLDPFCGAGTTGVAAVALDRMFIGCDLDAEAVETSRARLAAA